MLSRIESFLRDASEILTEGTLDFTNPKWFVIGLPFWGFFYNFLVKRLINFSFSIEEKRFYPYSSDSFPIFDKASDSHPLIRTEYQGKPASYLAEHTIIFHNLFSKSLSSIDFIDPVTIQSSDSIEVHNLTIHSDNPNNRINSLSFNSVNTTFSFEPKYISSKSYIKLAFTYHSEKKPKFRIKTMLADGRLFDEEMDFQYSKNERQAIFSSIDYGNNIKALFFIALISTIIFYSLILLSFQIVAPISEENIINPLSISIFASICVFLFYKLRKWEEEFFRPLKNNIWHQLNSD